MLYIRKRDLLESRDILTGPIFNAPFEGSGLV